MENRFHNIVAYQTVGDKQSWTRLSSASLSTKLYLQKPQKALIIEKRQFCLICNFCQISLDFDSLKL